MDCGFCATATLGYGRNLTAGEIVEQVYRATKLAGRRPTNLVFMGMGEPMHNLDNVTRALALLQHPWGLHFSPRRITVSTVGLVPGIEKLGQLSPAPNLAISLNATTDEVRDRIMPVNRKWPIAKLLEAARKFPLAHGRHVTFEYVLLAGVNDSDADADRLIRLLRGMPCKVNLIPWNPFPGPGLRAPVGRAHPDVPGAAARRPHGRLHPHAARRRHRRRLRAARRARGPRARLPPRRPSTGAV